MRPNPPRLRLIRILRLRRIMQQPQRSHRPLRELPEIIIPQIQRLRKNTEHIFGKIALFAVIRHGSVFEGLRRGGVGGHGGPDVGTAVYLLLEEVGVCFWDVVADVETFF